MPVPSTVGRGSFRRFRIIPRPMGSGGRAWQWRHLMRFWQCCGREAASRAAGLGYTLTPSNRDLNKSFAHLFRRTP